MDLIVEVGSEVYPSPAFCHDGLLAWKVYMI